MIQPVVVVGGKKAFWCVSKATFLKFNDVDSGYAGLSTSGHTCFGAAYDWWRIHDIVWSHLNLGSGVIYRRLYT